MSLIWETAVFLCLSADAEAEPFALEGCREVLGGVGVFAMFLNVIWHSISSPAKTVCWVHWTNTRMFVNGADISWARAECRVEGYE